MYYTAQHYNANATLSMQGTRHVDRWTSCWQGAPLPLLACTGDRAYAVKRWRKQTALLFKSSSCLGNTPFKHTHAHRSAGVVPSGAICRAPAHTRYLRIADPAAAIGKLVRNRECKPSTEFCKAPGESIPLRLGAVMRRLTLRSLLRCGHPDADSDGPAVPAPLTDGKLEMADE